MCSTRSAPQILIIQHASTEHGGALKRALCTFGFQTIELHVYRGVQVPRLNQLPKVDGIVSLGGPMGVNDTRAHPWILEEIRLISEALAQEVPIVGSCLGGQLLASALGAKVTRNSKPEIGWHPIELTFEGIKDPVLGTTSTEAVFYQWHYDTFETPPGAIRLAFTSACENQAYRYSDFAYGFQFHPEVDGSLMREWFSHQESLDEIDHAHLAQIEDNKSTLSVQSIARQIELASQAELYSMELCLSLMHFFAEKIGSKNNFHPEKRSGKTEKSLEVNGTRYELIRDENTKILWPVKLPNCPPCLCVRGEGWDE